MEPRFSWARGAPPCEPGSALGPHPGAAGARRPGERRVSSRLRQETRTSSPMPSRACSPAKLPQVEPALDKAFGPPLLDCPDLTDVA